MFALRRDSARVHAETHRRKKKVHMEFFVGILGFIFGVCFVIHFIGYYYLEIANDYDSFPFFKVSFSMFSFYDKPVKPKHSLVKKITDLSLRIMIIVFFITLSSSLLVFAFQ